MSCDAGMDIDCLLDMLISSVDEETEQYVPYLPSDRGLLLCGSMNSVFLNAIKRKADSLGIRCGFDIRPYTSVVHDRETTVGYYITRDCDVDCLYNDGMSSVAIAILSILTSMNMVCGRNITIVGRGHAVKGLAEALIDLDATVTVAHSKTKNLRTATENRDVVIYATPKLTKHISHDTKDLVIDLGGVLTDEDMKLFQCAVVKNIGKLTVSTLLNRFVRWNLVERVTMNDYS